MPHPVIIDTDPGVDDIVAILLALTSPEIQIVAFVLTFGNTDRDSCYLNIFKAYQAIARHLEIHPEDQSRFPNFKPEVPPLLVRGAKGPLGGEYHTAQYFHGRDGLGNISERHPELSVDAVTFNHQQACFSTGQDTVESLLDLIRSYPSQSLTYIVLGPMTSLAQMMKDNSATIIDRVGRFVCMGGAVDVPGNTSPSAEFNFFADPFAVKELILDDTRTGLPLDRFILLPLDITTPHELPFARVYKKFVDPEFENSSTPSKPDGKSPITHFTSSFLERTRELMIEFGLKDAMELHDIVAVWCAICNPPIQGKVPEGSCGLNEDWVARKRVFDIERHGELTRGMLVVDRRNDASAYSPGTNRAQVQKESGNLHVSDQLWESTAVPALVEVEAKPILNQHPRGVWCVTHTPGPQRLLELILKRIWGVSM
ncbi:Inosine/uridine-preferring nucleoside hydrolase domain-containing protein [Coprinopsis sp. MPI-PUGE-AT-0042]|nr:Inosine/uridine-preferring nucleoside hydrolase domain-containing protein [Coprinopsis sp. MPI-PUGE-AT-0042]